MKIKFNTVKRSAIQTTSFTRTTSFKSSLTSEENDFVCPHCEAEYTISDYHTMRTKGVCPYCMQHVYYYSHLFWEMNLVGLKDDPKRFADTIRSISKDYVEPLSDHKEVLSLALKVAFELGLTTIVTDYNKYIGLSL